MLYDERRSRPWLARLALIVAMISCAMLAASGPGYRMGWFGLATALNLLRWAAYAGVASAAFAVVALIVAAAGRGGTGTAVAALLLAAVSFGFPWLFQRKAQAVPRIHDITTDTANPPAFVHVVPLRTGARNPVEYGGPEVAAKQREGYPDIAPLAVPLPANQAFDRALATARTMGWEIVASDPAAGQIEATDTTLWFGFKDDIVIRVTPAPGGSKVDVRSLSRVGVSDVGANAARIRKYLAALRTA